MKKLITIVLFCLSFSLIAGQRGACRQEIDNICKEHRGDRQAMRQCVEENKSQLSAECQERIENRKERGGKGRKRGK